MAKAAWRPQGVAGKQDSRRPARRRMNSKGGVALAPSLSSLLFSPKWRETNLCPAARPGSVVAGGARFWTSTRARRRPFLHHRSSPRHRWEVQRDGTTKRAVPRWASKAGARFRKRSWVRKPLRGGARDARCVRPKCAFRDAPSPGSSISGAVYGGRRRWRLKNVEHLFTERWRGP